MRVVQVLLVASQLGLQMVLVHSQSQATALRVAAVMPAPEQPQLQDTAVIFYDDFDKVPNWRSRYFEYSPAEESFRLRTVDCTAERCAASSTRAR